jgi:Fe-S cluster biogenesis protein NfuA
MSNYSKRAVERASFPQYTYKGSFPEENVFRSRHQFPEGLGIIELWGQVSKDLTLGLVRYQTDLSGLPLAFIDVLVELCQGKKRLEILKITAREVENYLRDRNDLEAYNKSDLNEDQLLTTVSQLIFEMNRIISDFVSERELSPETAVEPFAALSDPFQELTLVDRIKAVNALLALYIRPTLERDGGDIILVNIDGVNIYLSFLGNCGECPSSANQGGTIKFVSEVLKEKLSEPEINVSLL